MRASFTVRLNLSLFFTYAIKNRCCPFNICGFASFLTFIFERIIEQVIQIAEAALGSDREGTQNDSFGAIFVASDEEGEASSMGKDSHAIKRRQRVVH